MSQTAPAEGKAVLPLVLSAVVSLGAGFLVLLAIQNGIDWLWEDAPTAIGDGPLLWVYVLAIPVAAGLGVAFLRQRYNGHNPLEGFQFTALSLADFPFALGGILVTLLGGMILGPEIAMITTGSMIGTLFARGHSGKAAQRIIAVGGLFGLLALAIKPALTDSQRLVQNPSYALPDLAVAAGVAVVAALIVAGVRWVALTLQRVRGGDPAIAWQLALGGLIVGSLALGYHLASDQPLTMILTSGEGHLKDLAALTSVGLVLVTVAVKTVGYAVSLGGGFRGGPYFPVFFVGAGIGTAASLQFGTVVGVAAMAGLLAATTNLAHAGWPVTVVIGLGIGFLVGGLAMLPAAIIAALVGRLMPHPAPPAPAQPSVASPTSAA